MGDVDPPIDVPTDSTAEVPLDAGPKPALAESGTTAAQPELDGEADSDEEVAKEDVGLEHLYENEELPEEEEDDVEDFSDPGEAGDEDYEGPEDDDDDYDDEEDPEPAQVFSQKRRAPAGGSSQSKRTRTDDE